MVSSPKNANARRGGGGEEGGTESPRELTVGAKKSYPLANIVQNLLM